MIEKIKAAELLTTGRCPLNCSYCYIPKSTYMKEMHEKIVASLEDGSYIKNLKTFYGDRLEYLGFWGTEPLLTLDLLSTKLEEIFKEFPRLKEISFSTSFMLDYSPILRFLDRLIELGKPIEYKVQISLDGPEFITDKNRIKGAASKIPVSFHNILLELNNKDLKNVQMSFRWKPTLDISNIREMVEDPNKIDEFYLYFRNLYQDFDSTNKNKNITIAYSDVPSLAVPGKYTTEDGKIFAKYMKLLNEKKKCTTYTSRMERILKFYTDLPTKKSMFTCSGGDSNFGIGTNVHICHRTFYYDIPEYVESILKEKDIENWDISHFEKGTLKHIQKRFTVDPNDEEDTIRFLYVLRGFHDFWKFQFGYLKTALTELAYSKQIDEEFITNEGLQELFTWFALIALCCPMENLLNTSSIHLVPFSTIRLFCNGAFQEMMKGVKC